jgi:hypothetical protein
VADATTSTVPDPSSATVISKVRFDGSVTVSPSESSSPLHPKKNVIPSINPKVNFMFFDFIRCYIRTRKLIIQYDSSRCNGKYREANWKKVAPDSGSYQ